MVFLKVQIINFSFWLMNKYILNKGQGLEWHMYVLTDQFDYSGLFD